MNLDELQKFAVTLATDARENSEIIRKLQMQVSAQNDKIDEIIKEKNSIAAKRDYNQMKLDVYTQIVDELLEKILKIRGYND